MKCVFSESREVPMSGHKKELIGASKSTSKMYPFWTPMHAKMLTAVPYSPLAFGAAVECTEDLS